VLRSEAARDADAPASAFLTLEVLPVLYTIWRTHELRRARAAGVPIEAIVGAVPAWARA
jgi:hypothetical protein